MTLLEAAKALLASIDDDGLKPRWKVVCPECDAWHGESHHPDCQFGNFIKALREAVEREEGASVPGA